MVRAVDSMLSSMTDAASNLGAVNKRISMQEDFVSNLMSTIDKGIGRLVDADMNEESTRLKALQTQQQLGIQALSIANANSQNVLSLFR
jgi:flagellin